RLPHHPESGHLARPPAPRGPPVGSWQDALSSVPPTWLALVAPERSRLPLQEQDLPWARAWAARPRWYHPRPARAPLPRPPSPRPLVRSSPPPRTAPLSARAAGRSAPCRPRRNQSVSPDSKIGTRSPPPIPPAGGPLPPASLAC